MPVLQNMKTRNDGMKCVEKQSAHSIPAPPHHADSLAHCQSEYPVAQMADSQPPQTLHAESEQTTSGLLIPTQLNTPNIFDPDLIRVSPNVQRLGWCVPSKWPQSHCSLDVGILCQFSASTSVLISRKWNKNLHNGQSSRRRLQTTFPQKTASIPVSECQTASSLLMAII